MLPTYFMFLSLGPAEWMMILIVGLLVFGRRLPEVGRSLGKSFVELKRSLKDIEKEVKDVERMSSDAMWEAKNQTRDALNPWVDDVDHDEEHRYQDEHYGPEEEERRALESDTSFDDSEHADLEVEGKVEPMVETKAETELADSEESANEKPSSDENPKKPEA